jgi:hypothetical protein
MTLDTGADGQGLPGISQMPDAVMIGQQWSAWIPARQQWLLATVVGFEAGLVRLKCDARYGMKREGDFKTDQGTMLENRNLFRFVQSAT